MTHGHQVVCAEFCRPCFLGAEGANIVRCKAKGSATFPVICRTITWQTLRRPLSRHRTIINAR